MSMVEGILSGDVISLARAISAVENDPQAASQIVQEVYSKTGNAHVIGFTGPPGAGKSSLVGALIGQFRSIGASVGVVAVDPTSPFTGGAILGDRIRMQSYGTDPGVFIRSMATRGHLGGLSRATGDAIHILDASGKDIILVETVGSGQSEVDVMKFAHTVVVVLAPGLGDEVQVIKAGIMEIADIFVVNKADHEGAERTATAVEMLIESKKDGHKPAVFKTVATKGEGVADVFCGIRDHGSQLKVAGDWKLRAWDSFLAEMKANIIEDSAERTLQAAIRSGFIESIYADALSRKISPRQAGLEIIKRYMPDIINDS
jgi:LAO/AO transport system kinase